MIVMLDINIIVLVVYPLGEELCNEKSDPCRAQSCMLIYNARVYLWAKL